MKRRMTLVILLSFVLGGVFTTYGLPLLERNKTKKNSVDIKENDLSIMVYDDTTKSYVKRDAIPIGDYELNEANSYCINGGTISNYDSANGTIDYIFSSVDECYVYFDAYIEPAFTINFDSVTATDVSGRYTNLTIDNVNYENIYYFSEKFCTSRLYISYSYNGKNDVLCSVSSTVSYTPVSCSIDSENNQIIIGWGGGGDEGPNAKSLVTIMVGKNTHYMAFAHCFQEDTLVLVWDRKKKKKVKKRIKDINIGDVVYTYDPISDKYHTTKVKEINIAKTREICKLIFDDEEIITTPDHPFYLKSIGWLNAGQLKSGYEILCDDGETKVVKEVLIETIEEQEMYSLILENKSKSFMVGKNNLVSSAMYVSLLVSIIKVDNVNANFSCYP